MNLAIVIVVASVLALTAILWLTVARKSQISRPAGPMQIQPVDVEAFRNLVSPAEDAYLRERLSARDFRHVRRHRLLATAAYVKNVSRNAGVLVQIGQRAMTANDPRVKESAQQLVENALLLRRNATFALVRIYLTLAVPTNSTSLGRVADSYEKLSFSAMLLGRLQNPNGPVQLSVLR